MSKNYCCLCKMPTEDNNDAILTMGRYGTPRYLCERCEARLDALTLGSDVEQINKASEEIAEIMRRAEVDDELIIETVSDIMAEAKQRRDAIIDGSYDFSVDAADEKDEEAPEITEELTDEDTREETPEERAKREKAEKVNKNLDKITPWIYTGVIAALIAFLLIKLLL